MIKPTPGRVVLYTPHEGDADLFRHDATQPLAAIVTYVWSDNMVNLSVFNQNGRQHERTSVLLLQDDAIAPCGPYAEWMSFQKGQAEKQETKSEVSRLARNQALSILSPTGRALQDYMVSVNKLAKYIETGELPAGAEA